MRVLYLTQWFEPEPVMKGIEFAKALEGAGFDVDVMTGLPNYPHGRLYPGYRWRLFQAEQMQGIRVNRMALYPSHDRSALRRSLNYVSFFCSALAFCLARGGRYDVIYVYHPPITVGLAAAVSGVLTRTPFVLDVQDLWPDSVTASGMAGSQGPLTRLLNAACDFCYRRAAAIVAQSEGIGRRLIERGVSPSKLSTIYNWSPGEEEPASVIDLAPYGMEGRFNFVYAGNMGSAQALDVLVEAAGLACAIEPRIQLILIGSGTEADALAKAASGGHAVRLEPPLPRRELKHVLAAADVLTVHLADKPLYRITIPSKTQFYLARGKPVLAAVNGETGAMIRELGAGVAIPAGDPRALADAMVDLARASSATRAEMGARARAGYLQRFSLEAAIAATAGVIRQAASHAGRRRT